MIGGTVIETIVLPDKVWINCRDDNHPLDECAIYVELTDKARSISDGDCVWWQSREAMWTPGWNRDKPWEPNKGGVDRDIVLKRIGYSGVPRPKQNDE